MRHIMQCSLLAAGLALASFPGAAQTFNDVSRVGAVDPVQGRIYTAGNDGTIRMIDGATLQSTSYFVGANGRMVVNAITNRVYIDASNAIIEFDGAARTFRTIPLQASPIAIAMNLATNKLYAILSGGTVLSVLDASTGAVHDITLGSAATGIGIDPKANRIYLAGSSVQVVDGATEAVTSTGIAALSSTVLANPASNKVFMMTADNSASITAIDGATLTATAVPTSGSVYSLALNPLTNRVYAGTGGSGNFSATLAAIDGETFARTDFDTGNVNRMTGLAVNSLTNKVYAAAVAPCTTVCPPGTAITLDGDTNTAATTSALQGNEMAVDPRLAKLYMWLHAAGPLAIPITVWSAADVSASASPSPANAPGTSITPLPANAATTSTPRFTFTTTPGVGGMAALAVFFSVDSPSGPWTRAQGTAPTFSGRTAALADGAHTLYAFAVDATVSGFPELGGTSVVGPIASYAFTVANACSASPCSDLSLEHSAVPAVGFVGKDAVYRLKVTNQGAAAATGVVVSEKLPLGTVYVWASPGCQHHFFTFPEGLLMYVWCTVGNLAAGASAEVTLVIRPTVAGTVTTTANASADELDPQTDDNTSTANVNVSDPPPANITPRYRLYSPVTLEHHYTTDANEYAVLGSTGNWNQEGQAGSVLDNPGSYNGVQAVPYYRLYNSVLRWHHWTTDPNEYYTLITYPGWHGEDVAGYIFPSQAPGTIPLYRLTYPFVPGLHHWTIDANEYNTLTASYGWVGEGGSGFVMP